MKEDSKSYFMKNDNVVLWKLKHGQAFLDAYLKCGHMVYEGKKCLKATAIRLFIRHGLLHEIPQSVYLSLKNVEIKLGFTKKGISIYDQLLKLVNRGIIYKEKSGDMNWQNFQLL